MSGTLAEDCVEGDYSFAGEHAVCPFVGEVFADHATLLSPPGLALALLGVLCAEDVDGFEGWRALWTAAATGILQGAAEAAVV